MLNIIIREETENDYKTCEEITKLAFENSDHCNHKEHLLVAKLRTSDNFVPKLSLVVEFEGKLIAHIMYTGAYITCKNKTYVTIALAPVSVLPEYQHQGIGSYLINYSLDLAKQMGYKSAIVMEHINFYHRFGFVPAINWGLKLPFEVPSELFMARELVDGGLSDISGVVSYAKEFFEKF